MGKRNPLAIISDNGIDCIRLDPREEWFCLEYLIDADPAEAAKRSGYAHPSKDGARLMRRGTVRARIRYHQEQQCKRIAITADRVVVELSRLAFADIRRAITWDDNGNVSVNASDEIDDETALAIQGVKQRRTVDKDGNETTTLEIDMANKGQALAQLCKTLGISKEVFEVRGKVEHEHEHTHRVEPGVTAEAAQSIRDRLWGKPVIDAEVKELAAGDDE